MRLFRRKKPKKAPTRKEKVGRSQRSKSGQQAKPTTKNGRPVGVRQLVLPTALKSDEIALSTSTLSWDKFLMESARNEKKDDSDLALLVDFRSRTPPRSNRSDSSDRVMSSCGTYRTPNLSERISSLEKAQLSHKGNKKLVGSRQLVLPAPPLGTCGDNISGETYDTKSSWAQLMSCEHGQETDAHADLGLQDDGGGQSSQWNTNNRDQGGVSEGPLFSEKNLLSLNNPEISKRIPLPAKAQSPQGGKKDVFSSHRVVPTLVSKRTRERSDSAWEDKNCPETKSWASLLCYDEEEKKPTCTSLSTEGWKKESAKRGMGAHSDQASSTASATAVSRTIGKFVTSFTRLASNDSASESEVDQFEQIVTMASTTFGKLWGDSGKPHVDASGTTASTQIRDRVDPPIELSKSSSTQSSAKVSTFMKGLWEETLSSESSASDRRRHSPTRLSHPRKRDPPTSIVHQEQRDDISETLYDGAGDTVSEDEFSSWRREAWLYGRNKLQDGGMHASRGSGQLGIAARIDVFDPNTDYNSAPLQDGLRAALRNRYSSFGAEVFPVGPRLPDRRDESVSPASQVGQAHKRRDRLGRTLWSDEAFSDATSYRSETFPAQREREDRSIDARPKEMTAPLIAQPRPKHQSNTREPFSRSDKQSSEICGGRGTETELFTEKVERSGEERDRPELKPTLRTNKEQGGSNRKSESSKRVSFADRDFNSALDQETENFFETLKVSPDQNENNDPRGLETEHPFSSGETASINANSLRKRNASSLNEEAVENLDRDTDSFFETLNVFSDRDDALGEIHDHLDLETTFRAIERGPSENRRDRRSPKVNSLGSQLLDSPQRQPNRTGSRDQESASGEVSLPSQRWSVESLVSSLEADCDASVDQSSVSPLYGDEYPTFSPDAEPDFAETPNFPLMKDNMETRPAEVESSTSSMRALFDGETSFQPPTKTSTDRSSLEPILQSQMPDPLYPERDMSALDEFRRAHFPSSFQASTYPSPHHDDHDMYRQAMEHYQSDSIRQYWQTYSSVRPLGSFDSVSILKEEGKPPYQYTDHRIGDLESELSIPTQRQSNSEDRVHSREEDKREKTVEIDTSDVEREHARRVAKSIADLSEYDTIDGDTIVTEETAAKRACCSLTFCGDFDFSIKAWPYC